MSATQQARTLVIELIKAGVTDLVIAPGSRNGPISLAALAAANEQKLNVTVRIDERSAAFTALGPLPAAGAIAKAESPTPVLSPLPTSISRLMVSATKGSGVKVDIAAKAN